MARIWRAALQRPGRSLILLLFSAAAAAIMMNALLFQKARHPSPMVSQPGTATPAPRTAERRADPAPASVPAPVTPAAMPAASQPAQLPPSRPGDLSQAAREAAPRPPASIAAAPRQAPAPAQTAAQRNPAPPRERDPIADLINGVDMRPPAEIRGVASARPAAPRRTVEN